MTSPKDKQIQVTVPPEFLALAQMVDRAPGEILEQFIQDLLRLPHSGGSDERDKAGEYFLRTEMAGMEHYEEVSEFIASSRAEYVCQVCKKWVRHNQLRHVREPRPHYVCWRHPALALVSPAE
jgi:hypothetical protein